ncbi:hypothetical protein ABL78_7043 [Leptomonas seymouri]|uniref:DUF676 domain-containing protein n=1 Tax=Leptomonas seymouri TaxID=5684 RepID=A0A0N0P3P6_LEPSE|nr:hypothetical protein ABL78_7043 [Leptomonas seymouri]|eukprot:KPI83907.1 hypothetical protein ABL78_7043 [Leptomonas seymouri]
MASSAPPAKSAEEFLCLHFVFLHHGYHGRAADFNYLSQIAENALRSKHGVETHAWPHFVFIHPHGSDRLRTEEGVLACARRYIDHACAIISKTLSSPRRNEGDSGSDGRIAAADTAADAAPVELHFSAVGHSMGGLILRAALPHIMRRVEELVSQTPQVYSVQWDTFCTMAAPHLGVHYMRSPFMTFLGGNVGHLVSPAIADLFAKNTLLWHDLVSGESLGAWARFKRRVLINAVNDGTVLVYSSSFVLPVSVRERIGAAVPPSYTAPAETPVVPQNEGEPKGSAVADAVRGPSHDNDPPDSTTMMSLDVPNTDASVVHLAKHGIYCASSLEGLQCNAYELKELSEELWPSEVLPEQRALAERILRGVGSLELHLIDFRPLRDAPLECLPDHVAKARAELSLCGRVMTHLGAHKFSHAAMACKSPFYYPAFFGLVPEYIVTDLLGIPLMPDKLPMGAKDAAASPV